MEDLTQQLTELGSKLERIEQMVKLLLERELRVKNRGLTERQKQVLELKKQGLTDQQISEQLKISRSRVTSIVGVLRRKGFEV
jgi:DNA-binding NarL/FixJ family response regulator